VGLKCKRNSFHVLFSENPDSHFNLYSIKTKTISSFWCKLLYPFSPVKDYRVCVSGWYGKGMTKVQSQTFFGKKFVVKHMLTTML